LKLRQPDVLDSIRETGELKPETEATLTGFLDAFAKTFS
jgi:hypothetical protein